MMTWRDQGLVIALRPHSENSAIVEVLTQAHGRHAGVVRGATSSKRSAHLQLGNEIAVTWSARLEDHLGSYTIEPIRAHVPPYLNDRMLNAGLGALCAMAHQHLPERLVLDAFYDRTYDLITTPEPQSWPERYVLWELALLEFLGFGLDLSSCAVTGRLDELRYISPRTGCAVSAQGAGAWAPKLFAFPDLLKGTLPTTAEDLKNAFDIMEHFLTREVAHETRSGQLPAARARFVTSALSRKSLAG